MKTKFLIILALAFVTASCTKPTQSYYVQDSNRAWFADTANLKFTMRDNNGVSQSFSFADIDQYMSEQESYFMGIYVKGFEFEHVYQSGFSSFSTLNMSVSLTADHLEDEPEGTDDFRMDLGPAHYTMRIDGNKFYSRCCYEYKLPDGSLLRQALRPDSMHFGRQTDFVSLARLNLKHELSRIYHKLFRNWIFAIDFVEISD